jgi:hypothetical protein
MSDLLQERTALVVTSIHPPNRVLRSLAAGCAARGWDFVVAGDGKSPADFALDGCRFLSLADQRAGGFELGRRAPEGSYTRKNLGYLAAIRGGARVLVETDDDNHPDPGFWDERREVRPGRAVVRDGWVNAYRYFSETFIYPRGLPLAAARAEVPEPAAPEPHACPVQQGLADEDPDVDAVYRMLFPLPVRFERGREPVVLGGGAWCPFNSQNTTFFPAAFPLLYLPAHCSFRMTDIWRSFVAQRVLHARGLGVMFHGATVWQERNQHDLQRDFADELPGYLHNDAMRRELVALPLPADLSVRAMMERCYEALMRRGWVGAGEEELLEAWFADLEAAG